MPPSPAQPSPQDRLAIAIDVALGIQQQIGVSLQMAGLRRTAGYQALLVASALDDARRLHAALGESLNRIVGLLSPAAAVQLGLAEPVVPKVDD